MVVTTIGEGERAVVGTKVYANGRIRLSATAPRAAAELVTHALERSARIRPFIDLDFFRGILLHGGLDEELVHAIAATAEIYDDESYYGPRQQQR